MPTTRYSKNGTRAKMTLPETIKFLEVRLSKAKPGSQVYVSYHVALNAAKARLSKQDGN